MGEINPFQDLIKSLESESELSREFSKKADPLFNKTIEYCIDTIIDKINNIENLDVNEIKNIIMRQHSMILNYDLFLKSSRSRMSAQKLFTNKKFLSIFIEIVSLLNLTREEIICINKLAYDYYILADKNKEISEMLLYISYQINNVLVIKLSAKLGINEARALSMIANSSFKEDKCIHRINTFLLKCNREFGVQDIIDIYCILFERVSNLFIYTMLECKVPNMAPDQIKKFDRISSAILLILDSMTSADIKNILYNYAYIIKLTGVKEVRFSLKSATDFNRIRNIIYEIENDVFDELVIP